MADGPNEQQIANASIFESGERVYRLPEVLSAAGFRGDLEPLYQDLREGQACHAYAEEEGFALEMQELQAASEDYRYARDLITAEETEAWLQERHLTLDDFNDFLTREHWRRRFSPDLDRILPEYSPLENLTASSLWAGMMLGDRFKALVIPLARRVAVMREYAADPPAPQLAEEVKKTFLGRIADSAPDLESWLERNLCSRAWFEELSALEAHFQKSRYSLLAPDRCLREVHAHRIDLTRIDAEGFGFPSKEMAQESFLCMIQDGENPETVVQRAGGNTARCSWLVKDLSEEGQQIFISAPPGEFLPPLEWDGAFWIFRVARKIDPDLEDPEVRPWIEEKVLDLSLNPLVDKHVRWLCPVTWVL